MPRKPRWPSCRTAGPPASNAAQPGPQNPAQHTPLPRPERDPSPPEVEPSGAERPRVRVLPSLGSPPPPVRRLPSAGGHTNRASAADRCQLPKRGAVGLLREQKRKWPRGRERRGAERLPGSRRTRRVGPRGKMATGRRGRASSTVVSCTPRPQGRGPRPPKDGAQGCCASRSQLSFKPPCPCFLEVLSSDPTLK